MEFFLQHSSQAAVDAAVLLYHELSIKLRNIREDYIELLNCSYSLTLFALAQLQGISHPLDDTKVDLTLAELQKCLKIWVANANVIGGDCFGGQECGGWRNLEGEVKV